MYDQLYEYLNENSLLSDHQFGFRKFHPTASALLDCTNSWYMNMDRKMFNTKRNILNFKMTYFSEFVSFCIFLNCRLAVVFVKYLI